MWLMQARRELAARRPRWEEAEVVEEDDLLEVRPEHTELRPSSEDRVRHRPRDRGLGAPLARAALALVATAFFLSTFLPTRRGQRDKAPNNRLKAGHSSSESIVGAQELDPAAGPGDTDPSVFIVVQTATSTSVTGVTLTTALTTVTTTTPYSTTTSGESTTTETVFFDRPPPTDFPEIMYLTIPESDVDHERRARMKQEVIKYLPQQFWGVRVINGVKPELWPQGRYDRVFKYGQMLPRKQLEGKKGAAKCSSWTQKDQGGLYNHFYDAAPAAHTLDACKEHCCKDTRCKAIRFSPSAVDGPELQCLLYPRGMVAWSLERPLYEDYRAHLLDEESEDGDGDGDGDDDDDRPWWEARNFNMARVTSTGEHPRDKAAWPPHHCGCSLSHFTMWMEALQRGVQNLVVFESDGYPTCVESFRVGGNASDFSDLLASLPSKAPEGWHLIALDKGHFGAQLNPPTVATIRPASADGNRTYSLIPWKGRGVAGAAAYMVSRRFLEWFPHDIQAHGFNMVDAWIGCRCSDLSTVNPSPINCYSIVVEGKGAAS